jgi:hypothetical protein
MTELGHYAHYLLKVAEVTRMYKPKKIHNNDIIGQSGVVLVKQRLLEMGFQFYETGSVEAGIDGIIEIRDPASGAVTNQIIQVQVKATTKAWTDETNLEFVFRCDERDLRYWLNGNAPVILVVSRPTTREAYWVPLKAYFAQHPEHRQERKILFLKRDHKFDKDAAPRLVELSLPKNRGVYFSPIRKSEQLISNLLEVQSFASHVHSADTEYTRPGHLWAEAKQLGVKLPSEWMLGKGRIWSFWDLREGAWGRFCDLTTHEGDLETDVWAFSSDPDERWRFVRLLRLCLGEMLWRLRLRYDKPRNLYYFKPGYKLSTGALKEVEVEYRTHKGRSSSITVFSAYPNHLAPRYYRHHAFHLEFRLFGDEWSLEITPTYHFTLDGLTPDFYYEDKLKGIKRLEGNRAVLSPVELLSWKLSGGNPLFGDYPLLSFGRLREFMLDFGLSDDLWGSEKDEELAEPEPLPLFDQ